VITERLAAEVAFELDEVLAATGGEIVTLGGGVRVRGVTTDTRGIEPGELFVPIRGERHDGHRYLHEAAERGAAAVLVDRGASVEPLSCTTIAVVDTLAALGDLAAWHRRRVGGRVLGVAGANGKTTTKEMLASIAAAAFGAERVLKTQGSQNNLVGLPLTLLRLTDAHAVAVLELGMNTPGEVWRLAAIADPDVGVVTCVGPEHLEGVGSLRGAAEAEGELYRRLRPSAVAVVSTSEPLLRPSVAACPGRVVTFGDGAAVDATDVQAMDVEDRGIDGTAFTLRIAGESVPVRLRVAGRHNVTNALAASAVAYAAGMPAEAIRQGLDRVQAPTMRMEVRRLASGAMVLNDCYNANPASMEAALQTVGATTARRRLAVLGEMRELGAHAEAAHRDLGRALASAGLDAVFLLGPAMRLVEREARSAGMPADRIVWAADHEALAGHLAGTLHEGDLVLLKGSRGAALEKVLERLEAGEA
jgi:UDP-N-acetylmuramoyl-tripeptide--D-alanyl-D-alanine ligase